MRTTPIRSTSSTGSAPIARGRSFRVGTGELADSLAFDSLTGISRDLVDFFAARENLTLELKTKTDEIENLLDVDPRGRVLVSWTLSPERRLSQLGASDRLAVGANRGGARGARRRLPRRVPFRSADRLSRRRARLPAADRRAARRYPAQTNLVHQHGRPADDAAVAQRGAQPFSRRSDALRRGRARRPTAASVLSRRCG